MPVAYRMSFNGKLDRLSSLIDRLRVHVSNALHEGSGTGRANLMIFRGEEGAQRLVFCPGWERGAAGCRDPKAGPGETLIVAAHITVSGLGRQLITALPEQLTVDLSKDPFLAAVAIPLIEEATQPRCGGQAAFARLCEVVVIRLLRHALEEGRVESGLLTGLAHPRLAAALVAIHEAPAEAWTLEKLAETAGMSRTQFAVTFRDLVGATPMGYLSNWRLEIARSELEAGLQVKAVATLCGFSSAAAFSRAFSRRFGYPPKQKRKQAG